MHADSREWELQVAQNSAEQLMVIMKANPKQGRTTAESDFSYLQSSYLLESMLAVKHALFEEDVVFEFHINACQVIAECMISTFKHWQLLSSTHFYAYQV